MPKNEYEHAEGLLHSEYEEQEEFLRLSQIVDKYVQLGNIPEGPAVRLMQIEVEILGNYRDMATREPGLKRFFIVLMHNWRNGVLGTKAIKGGERGKQGSLGGAPASPNAGYNLEAPIQPQEQKKGNFLTRMLGGK